MSLENYIPLYQLCTHYELEMSFFTNLDEFGLIELTEVKKSPCISNDKLEELEKIIRLHKELQLNFEGIDTVLHLLSKIDLMQSELDDLRNRLSLYEDNI